MGDKKYKAFISYSHADEAWGAWLQRSLEAFSPPGSLAQTLRTAGRSARLAPVFRDREDLPVAGSLNSAIQAALADSEFQIVLCSPNAANSRWVNEEIKLFHKLHGPGRSFALIVDGEPGAAAIAGRETAECFPPALRFALDPDGRVTDTPSEPLAADARQGGDGKKYALLKIAAGMLGVGLDDLVRRDAARRARQAWTITAASLVAATAAAALAVYAVAKGNEAALMRGKAENLIEFMLTDLKERLEPVGRLDVLEAVGDRALAYYADQDPGSLDDNALARRAKAMMQLGIIDFQRNDLEAAFDAYLAAETATAELLRRSPNNPDRIFDHAQNVFYVGEAALQKSDRLRGEAQYREYLRLAESLVALDADNPKWRLELAYATSNLGILKTETGEYAAAIPFFASSIEARRTLFEAAPDDRKLRLAYAYAISWRAYAELHRGHFRTAADLIRLQLETYGEWSEAASEDFSALDAVVTAQRRLATALFWLGETRPAMDAIETAKRTADKLIAREARNANWQINASHVQRQRSEFLASTGDRAGAMAAADLAVTHAAAATGDGAAGWFSAVLGMAHAQRLRVSDDPGRDESHAATLAVLLAEAMRTEPRSSASFIGAGALALASHHKRMKRNADAEKIVGQAAAALGPLTDRLPFDAKFSLAALLIAAGAPEKARPILDELAALGAGHPDFAVLSLEFKRIAAN